MERNDTWDPKISIEKEIDSYTEQPKEQLFTIKTANKTIEDAALRPNPTDLYMKLWYEGEICCLFADSNQGKSIFAVQMAEHIAQRQKVLLVDCELSDKQFQLRYTNPDTGHHYQFSENLLRAEINPRSFTAEKYEDAIINNIELIAQEQSASIIIIDNISYICKASEKGEEAGMLMVKLVQLKMKYGWSLLVIAHTPKRSLWNPITQNDLAGSKRLYNFFDSVFAIGASAKDSQLRYIKQLKVRVEKYDYDENNVMVFRIEKTDSFLHFEFVGFSSEREHLNQKGPNKEEQLIENVQQLHNQGKSLRSIAEILGTNKSKVQRILKSQSEQKRKELPKKTKSSVSLSHSRIHGTVGTTGQNDDSTLF